METEEQIINDIVDSVYGYDIPTKENDSKKIKLNEEERQKKCGDVLKQINSLCTRIEKELGKTINTSSPQMSTAIRLTVFTAIRAEISNKNEVLDANGKIDVGKFLDIVTKSKDEILGKVEADVDKAEETSLESFNPETNPETNEEHVLTPDEERELDDFIGGAEDFGIDFEDIERDALRRARLKVNEFYKKIQEKIDSGMTVDEAIKEIHDSMTPLEREELDLQLALVEIQDGYSLHREEEAKYQIGESDDAGRDDSSSKTEAIESLPKVQGNVTLPKENATTTRTHQISQGITTKTTNTAFCRTLGKKFHSYYSNNENREIPYNEMGGLTSDITGLMATQSALLKIGSNDEFMTYTRVSQGQKFAWADKIAELQEGFHSIMKPNNTPITQKGSRTDAFTSSEGLKRIMEAADMYTVKGNQYIPQRDKPIGDEEVDRFVEVEGVSLKSPTYREIIERFGIFNGINYLDISETYEDAGKLNPTALPSWEEIKKITSEYPHAYIPKKPVTTVIPEETVIGGTETETPPTTPPTGDPTKKIVDSSHPEIHKVQSEVAVPEEIIVDKFEPEVPPIPETIDKKAKGNDDAVTVKTEENIPLSVVKAFVGERATVRNTVGATEVIHGNSERGVSKDGTNNPQGTPTVEDEPKTGEVPEEPQ